MRARTYFLASLLLLLGSLPLAALFAWKRPGPSQAESMVVVPRGMNTAQLSERLESAGAIRSARWFRLWARLVKFRPLRGEYRFEPRASLGQVAQRLKRGDIHFTPIVLVPGLSAWSVQRRLKDFMPEEAFWELWKSPRLAQAAGFPEAQSLEGLLAPATYRLHRALEPEEILLQMVEAFRSRTLPKLEGGALSPYQTLVLASLVEKETSLPEERPKVAGVYLKRLRLGMRLQCDPTSQYARWLTGDLRFKGPDAEDVRREHPFNTYSVSGLPPTPIALPGPESIEAARAPEVGADLYFVATGKGGHHFSQSLNEHNRNVGAFRREIRARRQAAERGRAR